MSMDRLKQHIIVVSTCCTLISCSNEKAEKTSIVNPLSSLSVNNKASTGDFYRSAMATDNVPELLSLIEQMLALDANALDHSLKTKMIAKQANMTVQETIQMLRLMSGHFQQFQIDAIKPMLLSKNKDIAEQAYLLLLELPINKKTRTVHMQIMQHTTSNFIKSKARALLAN